MYHATGDSLEPIEAGTASRSNAADAQGAPPSHRTPTFTLKGSPRTGPPRGDATKPRRAEGVEQTSLLSPTQQYRASVLAQVAPSAPPRVPLKPSRSEVAVYMAKHGCSSMDAARTAMSERGVLGAEATEVAASAQAAAEAEEQRRVLESGSCLSLAVFSRDHDPLVARSRSQCAVASSCSTRGPARAPSWQPAPLASGRLFGADADTKFFAFGGLLHSVASGAICPVRGSYLVRLWRGGDLLKPRLALPAEAFWTATELEALLRACQAAMEPERALESFGTFCIALCHRWLSGSSPEPDGVSRFQLSHVGQFAESYIQLVCAPLMRTACGEAAVADCAIFWPYCSMYLARGNIDEDVGMLGAPSATTEVQVRLAAEGQRWAALWYGHAHTCFWVQPAHDDSATPPPSPDDGPFEAEAASHATSGWLTWQMRLAAFLKPAHKRLDISGHSGLELPAACAHDAAAASCWWHETLLPQCTLPTAGPPLQPRKMGRLLRTRHFPTA